MQNMTNFRQLSDSEKLRISSNKKIKEYYKLNPCEEVWMNDTYKVNVRRNLTTQLQVDGKDVTVAHLSIARLDNRAMIDWRHFQWIKNELVGDENEGCELYPAESRLVDGANQFHLWVFEDPSIKMPFGFNDGRYISEKSHTGETQRKWPLSRKPNDLEECEAKVATLINQSLTPKS